VHAGAATSNIDRACNARRCFSALSSVEPCLNGHVAPSPQHHSETNGSAVRLYVKLQEVSRQAVALPRRPRRVSEEARAAGRWATVRLWERWQARQARCRAWKAGSGKRKVGKRVNACRPGSRPFSEASSSAQPLQKQALPGQGTNCWEVACGIWYVHHLFPFAPAPLALRYRVCSRNRNVCRRSTPTILMSVGVVGPRVIALPCAVNSLRLRTGRCELVIPANAMWRCRMPARRASRLCWGGVSRVRRGDVSSAYR